MTLNTALGCFTCFILLVGVGILLAECHRRKQKRKVWQAYKEYQRRLYEFDGQ